jgi:TnpA family transposase
VWRGLRSGIGCPANHNQIIAPLGGFLVWAGSRGCCHYRVINANVRDATHVLDGLLYHESDIRIEEHYTDTAGFTDHVFGLCHLLGFRFAPRIRDLKDKRLHIPAKADDYPALDGMIGDTINQQHLLNHWDEVLRLCTSIRQGTVTASLMLKTLGSYPRQNGLALALREVGRIERTLYMLEWMQDPELRRRVLIGLNKGEARNALARAVFFNRQGEMRDRSFENQNYRASGLNLVVAAITLWNRHSAPPIQNWHTRRHSVRRAG